MGIKVVIEFRAKPGARAELAAALEGVVAQLGPDLAGFGGSTLHEALDDPDTLIEIAEWDSPEAQAAAVAQALEAGVYAHAFTLVAEPFRATRITARD